MNFNSILDYYNPHAKKLYSAFNNMKELCKRLSDPKYVALLRMTHEQNARDIIDQNRCVSTVEDMSLSLLLCSHIYDVL